MTDLTTLTQQIMREHPEVDWLVRSPTADDPDNSEDFFASITVRGRLPGTRRRFPHYGSSPEEALTASLEAYREHVGYVTRALQ